MKYIRIALLTFAVSATSCNKKPYCWECEYPPVQNAKGAKYVLCNVSDKEIRDIENMQLTDIYANPVNGNIECKRTLKRK